LVGAPVESHVLLQCIVEAFPKPLNTWYRGEGIVRFSFASSVGIFPQREVFRDDAKEKLSSVFSIY
jgi:hypothetical protein